MTLIGYNNLRSELDVIKDNKRCLQKEQDKLIQYLQKMDNIDKGLNKIE